MRRRNEQAVAEGWYRRVEGRARQLGSGTRWEAMGISVVAAGRNGRKVLSKEDLEVPASTGMVSNPRYKTKTRSEELIEVPERMHQAEVEAFYYCDDNQQRRATPASALLSVRCLFFVGSSALEGSFATGSPASHPTLFFASNGF